MTPSPSVYLQVVFQTIAVYAFLIAAIRLIGRRTLSQLTAVDLMVVLLLGSAVETSMVTANTSIKVGFLSATILLTTNFALNRLMLKSKKLRHLVNGGPIMLIHNGAFVQEHLWKVGLTEADVCQAMREREIGAVQDVRFGVLETDGTMNFIRRDHVVLQSPPHDLEAAT